jgi:cytochrome c5
MADPNANPTQSTPQEVIISVIAGLLAPLLAIFLVVQLIRGIQEKQVDTDTSEAANKAVVARIKPFATLSALDANAPKVEQSGQQVFTAVCSACHTPGALGAPKLNSKSDWGPRLGQGFDTLTKHAIEGIRQMPPRGGNPDLSDIELARAVAYMANSGGASFKEPASAVAPATAPQMAPAEATPANKNTADTTGSTAKPGAPVSVAPAVSTPATQPASVTPAKSAVASAKPATVDSGKGEAIYKQACSVCHAAGVAGAPKLGDKAAWAPRIAKGMEALYTSGLHGKGAMPAKGGKPSLADAEVKAAIDYMAVEAR